jgi:HD superfamily phosphohydrolase
MASKRIRLPFEDVRLSEAEVAVTQTRTFQRLFDLKQLGLAYLVYPNATHTRGAHSIRCLGEAVKILAGLKKNGEDISQEDEQVVRFTALLHDIGHLPFSHTLEDEHVILQKHDRAARLDRVLDVLQSELPTQTYVDLLKATKPTLLAISDREGRNSDWRSDLVGNTICADLLAYITADAEGTGIEKRAGHYRIYEYFQRIQNRLCIRLTKDGGVRTDIVSEIIDLLDMRFCLTERVFFHHAKCVASAMLARAARLAGLSDADEEELIRLGDEGFLQYLNARATRLVQESQPRTSGARGLLDSLRSRRLYQRIFKVGRQTRDQWDSSRSQNAFCAKWRDGATIETLLRYTEECHDLPLGSLVLWCPEGKAGMKLVEAKVIYETTSGVQGPKSLRSIEEFGAHFRGVKQRVNTIEDVYQDLWTFWVALDRTLIDRAAEVVKTLEEQLEIECDRVFRDTYLRRLPGFEARRRQLIQVENAFAGILPVVMQGVTQQSALSGDPSLDQSVVLEAIRAATEKKTGPKKSRARAKKRVEGQLDLLAGEPEGGEGPTDHKENP